MALDFSGYDEWVDETRAATARGSVETAYARLPAHRIDAIVELELHAMYLAETGQTDHGLLPSSPEIAGKVRR